MDQAVNFNFFMQLIRKYWRAITLCAVLGGVIAGGLTFFVIQPKYQASVQILVNRKSTNAATEYAGQQADVQMITTYKQLITNQVILKPVSELLDLTHDLTRSVNDLKKSVTVTSQQNSQVFSIVVTDKNAKSSAVIANQVADTFKQQVKKIIKVNNVTIVAPAEKPTRPISPRNGLNLLIGIITGMLAGFIYAGVRVLTDRRVHDVDFLTNQLGLTNLGIVNHQHHHSLKQQTTNIQKQGLANSGLAGSQLSERRV